MAAAAQRRLARLVDHTPPASASPSSTSAASAADWSTISPAPAPTYFHAPRLERGSKDVDAHLAEHG